MKGRTNSSRLALLCSILLAAAACLATAQVAVGSDWDAYNQARMQTSVGSNSFGTSLRSVLDYSFSTPLNRVQIAETSAPTNRFRRVVNDLLSGKQIKLVAVGGVATNGSNASNPGSNDYVAIYANYLMRAFPGAKVVVHRQSVGLAPSPVVAGCISSMIPSDADLILLEMTANDAIILDPSISGSQSAMSYEALVRMALSGSNKPAVMLAQSMVPGAGNGSTPFYLTPEVPQYAAVASFYGVPTVSMRNAMWDPAQAQPDSLFKSAGVSASDGSTPLDAGHKALADALVYYTQRTAEDLQLMPYGDWDQAAIDRDVPANFLYGQLQNNQDRILQNVTCQWGRQMGLSSCPSSVSRMCRLDFSSRAAFLTSYGNSPAEDSIGGLSRGALIGIIVGGAVLVLAVIGGLLACCIIRKRRQQAELYKQTLPVKAADVPSFHSDGAGYHGSPRVTDSGNKMSTAAVPVTADARQK